MTTTADTRIAGSGCSGVSAEALPRLAPQRRSPAPARLLLLLLLAVSGCTMAPRPSPNPPGLAAGLLAQCQWLFEQTDDHIDQAGVRHQGLARISGFPYLRINRFLASFGPELDSPAQINTWLQQLARLDAQARRPELSNLAGSGRAIMAAPLNARLDECRTRLVADLLHQPGQLRHLRKVASVPDDYRIAWRVAGLYPLSAPLVLQGVRRWHDEARNTFGQPLDQLAVTGQLTRWSALPAPEEALAHIDSAHTLTRDALGIPRLAPERLAQLFARYAPVWEIDVVDANDVIGTPVWDGGPGFDTTTATQYQLPSYTRFGDEVLLQLNYVIWFKARPGEDIYAGRFDGLTWRVTLGSDLQPLLYDSIHNCGCYHSFFPTASLQLRTDLPETGFEPPLVPQTAPPGPLVVRLEHQRHFIQRVYPREDADPGHPLVVSDYASLLALPGAKGHHSFFGNHGLVAGSERPERFILWPMGIRSPGAMRQWGRHAVAFVGRRHFDDPDLIPSLFKRVPGP
ncbi:hypothetical protein [Marinobacterium sedimentorum]|uniref:hypothetical protein n=1 Tax=Marinobacterium sedimentorum TaxID=2927804 RepID=UPI0020C5C3E9|nr:hypothetical protein [Marinobacterium sedimentorum]MCP8689349.1 hypothetical protein [Marinobacterium sedimentorum]